LVVLAVGAHPDDIEFGAGGTLARLARREKVKFLIYTAGEVGGDPRKRRQEAKKAAETIGAEVRILGHRDGHLKADPRTVRELWEEVEKTKATTVFCPHFEDTHQDHAAAGRIAMTCWKKVDSIFFYEGPTVLDFNPNVFSDISRFFEVKRRALECFDSQMHKPLMDIQQVRGIAQHRAWQCGKSGALFEAFVLFRSKGGLL